MSNNSFILESETEWIIGWLYMPFLPNSLSGVSKDSFIILVIEVEEEGGKGEEVGGKVERYFRE